MRTPTLLERLKSSEMTAILAIILLSILFQMGNSNFLTKSNIIVILRGTGYAGIVCIGMAFCLMSGLIDISVGSAVGLVSCCFAWLIVVQGISPIVATLLTAAVAVGAAMINVTVILKTSITSFIATVAMSYVLRGVAYSFSGGNAIYPLPVSITFIGKLKPFGISLPFVLFIIMIVLGELALRYTVWGLEVRATGSDRKIAYDTEVRVDFVNYSCFAIMGLMTALAGILISLRTSVGIAQAGLGLEFKAIVGCALGGVSIFGYTGTMIGAALGILLSGVIANGMVAVGIPIAFQDIVLGALLIAVLTLDIYKQKMRPIREGVPDNE